MRYQDQVVARQKPDIHSGLRDYMMRVYGHMGLGLVISGLVAYALAQSPRALMTLLTPPMSWLVLLAPFVLVLCIGTAAARWSVHTIRALFLGYSALMGVSLSTIFLAYTHESIAMVFGVSASMFLGMSLYGYTTRKDLTSMGAFLFMGVIGLVVAMMVNLWVKSSPVSMALSVIGVLLFTGLTAYDVQKIRLMYNESDEASLLGKKALLGALSLYLDFINMFLNLLRLFGNRR